MRKRNMPTDRTQRVDKKWGHLSIYRVIYHYTPRVMVIKMSKMAHFMYFLLMTATNQSQFGQNILVKLKDLILFDQFGPDLME